MLSENKSVVENIINKYKVLNVVWIIIFNVKCICCVICI